MLTLANSDFTYTPLSFIPIQNLHSDFTSEWYLTVGKAIVQTMGINAFMPYMGFCISWFQFYVKRRIDKKPGFYTKMVSI